MNVAHLTLPEARGLRETMAENAGIQHAEMARALAALLEIRYQLGLIDARIEQLTKEKSDG